MPKYIDRDALIASMRGKKPIDWFNAVYDAPYFETSEMLIEEQRTVNKCVKIMEENDVADKHI